MKTKTQEKQKNAFWVRIYDFDLLTSVYELLGTGKYESQNDFISQMIAIGVEKTYLAYGKRRALAEKEEEIAPGLSVELRAMSAKLKSIELTADDIFVMMNTIEMLTSSLYNLEAMKLRGEPVGEELLESGYLSGLPANIQSVKDQLTKRLSKKKDK